MNLKVVEKPVEKDLKSAPTKIDPKYIGKKMSRNEPCFCGSGKKYKRCCGAL
jgi:preprotein translocase subunit SecA